MKWWKASALAALGIAASSLGASDARADSQTRMKTALRDLQTAKAQLQTTRDKEGHKAKALEHINAAITEVKAGLAADKPAPKSSTSKTGSTSKSGSGTKSTAPASSATKK